MEPSAAALRQQGLQALRAGDLDRAIQADPKLQRAYYLRGLAAAKTGHYKQALADFDDRVKRDPSARDAALEIARVHLAFGDAAGARDALRKLKAQDPRAQEAQLGLAVIVPKP